MDNTYRESDVYVFLKRYGVSLSEYGSSELGLHRGDAVAFIDLLGRVGRSPLGIEVWRRHGGGFSIDSLGGWYSEGTGVAADLASARVFVSVGTLSDDDVVTVQFD